jgi:hypothetical protein
MLNTSILFYPFWDFGLKETGSKIRAKIIMVVILIKMILIIDIFNSSMPERSLYARCQFNQEAREIKNTFLFQVN